VLTTVLPDLSGLRCQLNRSMQHHLIRWCLRAGPNQGAGEKNRCRIFAALEEEDLGLYPTKILALTRILAFRAQK
jgi:hypothetical protein